MRAAPPWPIEPVYRRVDSCAGEVEAASSYFYSTWGEASDREPAQESRAS